jgi:hypothetical protein
MSYTFKLYGKTTAEILPINYARGEFKIDWPLENHPGPTLMSNLIGDDIDMRPLYLYPEHLSLLYSRFTDANPDGVEVGVEFWYENKYGCLQIENDSEQYVHDSGANFVDLIYNEEEIGFPRLKRYLPEIFDRNVIKKMLEDKWLDAYQLGKAINEGAVPFLIDKDSRWSPEWLAYTLSSPQSK